MQSGEERFARSVVRSSAPVSNGSEHYMPQHNPEVSAALVSALNAASDTLPNMPPASMQYSARSAPISSVGAPHTSRDNYNDPQLYNSRPVEQFDSAPATWSAWINEERRRSDMVDPAYPPKHASNGALFSHAMPPHFLDPKMSEFDELAARLPHGLLGGMLDSDASDTTSRSTSSRRARLGTEGSAPTMPGMDLFRHEESQNLSRLKALLGQCSPDTESIATALAHSGLPCTLPGLTKLISKFNKSDQWRRGLAVFHALPAVGLAADATVANAALGSCDRGAAADSAWAIYYLMCGRNLEADAISYKALISALCKGGQWQRGVVAFARAVEGGVPIEAATVMVLLFALTRAQQPQLAEALFCTAFGMFANLQPLLSVPWGSAESPTTSQPLKTDPMPCGAFSSGSEGSRTAAGSTKNDGPAGPVHTPFTSPLVVDPSTGDAFRMEAQLGKLGLSECPGAASSAASLPASIAIHSRPASAANSACPSAAATPSAGATTPASQAMPFGTNGMHSRRWSTAKGGSGGSDVFGAHAPEDSPQALLARILDLYKVLIENQASAKLAGVSQGNGQQFPLGQRVQATNTFLPAGLNDFANTLDHSQGGVREPEQPTLLAALVGWQREQSAFSQQQCANPAASETSGSLPSCSISRSNSITSLGTASGTIAASTAPSASARTATATATNAGSPNSSRDPSRADFFSRGIAHVDAGMFSSQQAMSGSLYGRGCGPAASSVLPTSRTVASLSAISTDPLCAACCNAMLSAYCSAGVPEADRAALLLHLLHSAGGSLEPDVVAYNTVMQAQAARGLLSGMLETLAALNASGLRPTTATYSTLMHAHIQHGATQAVLELWYQMLQCRVLPGAVCLRAYTLSAFRCGDTGHIQDARSRYFGHLLTLPPKQAASEACIFLNMHGALGPPNGCQWPPGLSPVELCATLMRRNGHQGHSQPHSHNHEHSHAQQAHAQARSNHPHSLVHAQAHHAQLQAAQQQMLGMPSGMPEPPIHMMSQAELQAHAQGYAQAQAHAQQIVHQAGGLATLRGVQLPSGQLV